MVAAGSRRRLRARAADARSMVARMGVAVWTARALDAALCDPACFERFSVLAGTNVLAVDVRARAKLSRTARARLALLPCVTVGVGVRASGGAAHEPAGDAAQLDLVLENENECEALARAVATRPLASLALVQLLRRSAALSLEQAVLDESLVYATLQAGPEFATFLREKKSAPKNIPHTREHNTAANIPRTRTHNTGANIPRAHEHNTGANISHTRAHNAGAVQKTSHARKHNTDTDAAQQTSRTRSSGLSQRDASSPVLRVWREGACLYLRLHRPERRNAVNAALRDALCEALALALRDATLAEVELSGAGPSFCSGGDLDEFGTLPDPAHAHAIRSTRSAALLLAACNTSRARRRGVFAAAMRSAQRDASSRARRNTAGPRVTARVHGACVGAGVELAAFCSRVRARADAFFALPELNMGLVPGAGGTASLPRRIGRQRTAWMALTCARVDAPTARAWGLVDDIEPSP